MSGSDGSSVRWTPEQLRAIHHIDGAMLVSAAAGSGKTAVLAARCAYLVCDAPEPCDVDELLVVTFTRAAAAEMRERIDRAIRERIEREPDPSERLLRQRWLIDRATITTLDAFNGSLVRGHFHLVGVDPQFNTLAPEDARLMQIDVAATMLDAEYESDWADALRTLLNGYFGGDDERLSGAIRSAHALIGSIVDPEHWRRDALARLGERRSETLQQFAELQQRTIAATLRQAQSARQRATLYDGLAAYGTHLDELISELHDREQAATWGDFDALAKLTANWVKPRLPTVKKETPGKDLIKDAIDSVKKQMSERQVFRLGRWTARQLRDDLARIAPVATYFLDLVWRFGEAYTGVKRGLRALDFTDTARLALRILQAEGEPPLRPSATAMEFQRRYRHVLVDEFQDNNPLQTAILQLVSRDRGAELGLDEAPPSNLFSVGDVKQSIYRFRLAEPKGFLKRQALLREEASLGLAIELQMNFRSRGPLLEAINDVFRRLMIGGVAEIEYDASHELRERAGGYPALAAPVFAGKPIELHLLPYERDAVGDDSHDSGDTTDDNDSPDRFEREAALIVQRIRELLPADVGLRKRVPTKNADGTPGDRPLSYGDIAILLRSARFKSSQVADLLRKAGVPVRSDDATGFFKATEVQDVLAVLRVLSNARQDVPLAAVLRSPMCAIPDKENALARIRIAFPDEPFHRAVRRYADERADPLGEQLKGMYARIERWRRMFQERSVAEGLLEVYAHNDYLTFNRALPDGEQRLANLRELLARAETFGTFERQGLDRFLAFLSELEAEDGLGRPSVEQDSADVVQVMTVHKSKGLEFPVVIVPDLGKAFNETSLNDPILLDRDLGVGLGAVELDKRIRHPTATSMVIRDRMRQQMIAEEIRVLYVAMTRAREHLILIGTPSTKESVAERWQAEWADLRGPLPDDAVGSARTPLDWLGAIWASTTAQGLGTFELIDHTAGTPASSEQPAALPAVPRDAWRRLQGDGDPTEPDAVRVIERLTYRYPHEAAMRQRATRRVTDLLQPEPSPATMTAPHRASALEWPRLYTPTVDPSALEIGTATHRLLQFLDFRRPLDAEDVQQQIAALVERRLMPPSESALVDVGSIVWLGTTDLVAEIRDGSARLMREQPIELAQPLPDGASDDLVLLRGRADAMILAPTGVTLVDYKSDRVDALTLPARVERYAPQVRAYAEAVRQISGRPVVRSALVFLRARQVVDVR